MPNEEEDILRTGEANDHSAMENLLKDSEVLSEHDDELEPDKPTETPPADSDPDADSGDKTVADDDKTEEDKPEDDKPVDNKQVNELEQKPEESDEDWEKRIGAIKPKRGASEKTINAIKEIKKAAHEQREGRKLAEKTVKELQQKLDSSETITPERKKQIEDAIAFRQAFDIENDPEFNEKFTKQIAQGEETVIGMLRSWKLPENAAKYIQDNGGVLRFRTSNELMPTSVKSKDGSRMTHAEWWHEKVESNLTAAQKEQLGDELLNLRQVLRTRDSTIKDAQANRGKFIQSRQEEAQKAAKDWENRIIKHAEKVLPEFGEFAKKKDIPQNASPEERKTIEEHNARFEQAQKIAQKYITDITPENLVEAALAKAYLTVVKDVDKIHAARADKAEARVKELEKQIADIKSAGKTIKQGATGKTTTDIKPSGRLSDEDAMAEALKTV
jgi:hypothetical protein